MPLVINQQSLAKLKKYAESHFITLQEFKRIATGDAAPVGERPGHVCFLDVGYKVALSVEEHQTKDGGTVWLRHMSMSVDKPDRLPHPAAMAQVGMHLGFPTKDWELDKEKCQLWLEGGYAVNVICEINHP